MEEVVEVVVDGRVLEEFHEVGIDGAGGACQCLVIRVDQGLGVFIVEGGVPKKELYIIDIWLVFGVAHVCIVERQGLAVERLVEVDKAAPESYLGDDVLEIEGELDGHALHLLIGALGTERDIMEHIKHGVGYAYIVGICSRGKTEWVSFAYVFKGYHGFFVSIQFRAHV